MMKFIGIILIALFFFSFPIYGQRNIEAGKSIFKSRCASCHSIDKRVIGPALKDVDKRHEEKWIIDFVHSSQTLIMAGDETAKMLFQEYNRTIMPDHKDLSPEQIRNIIAYIKNEGNGVPAKASKRYVPAYTNPYKDKNGFVDKILYLNFDEAQSPLKFSDTTSWLIIASIIALLLTIFYLSAYLNYVSDTLTSKKKRT
ncbi:c-type cytochrome [Sphingobacterium zeae]|uniref:Mono/diheme cytochrome c family protein n=1 Tax=Sphingobacterium zeae TaxID=1776859 RepID=A0ABU0U746_9SPHI|nr:cytochrome c [Sphingobacterium zeae]MDQ1150783.1 mono/diheme cytochrome c family protein [Sphingobacterium zeae]